MCVNTAGEDATCSGVVEHYVAIVNLASHSRCSSAEGEVGEVGGWVRWEGSAAADLCLSHSRKHTQRLKLRHRKMGCSCSEE